MELTELEKRVIYSILAASAEEDMGKLNAITDSQSTLAVRLAFDSGVIEEILKYLHPSLTVLVKLASEHPPSLQREEVLASLKSQLKTAENWLRRVRLNKVTSEQDTANCN